ncbi:RNA polymerase sigma factor [Acetivibrio cellulolyticus]|uniref:RNA polymerase sigma factor n=1 Tax=Acetivibrio cellulolyticus TaxID=35830 RepID=UPI0001E2D0DD|nr:sigma-70 family RNA polymerase sigma factor [Acetivibrio cellulolyticus]
MNSDHILIEDTLKGNTESFTLLIKKYQQPIYSLLFKMTLSKEDSEEIMQDVFLKAFNNLYKFDIEKPFSSWIYRIALNTFKTHYRKNKKNKNLIPEEAIPESLLSSYENIEDSYEIKEEYKYIVQIINTLNSDQKTALILRHVQGFSNKEVGEIMGISAEAVKMKVQRARTTIWNKIKSFAGGK